MCERQMWITWTKQARGDVVYPQNINVCTLNAKFENSTNLNKFLSNVIKSEEESDKKILFEKKKCKIQKMLHVV